MNKFTRWTYTLVFSIYCAVLSIFVFWALSSWYPEFLIHTDQLTHQQLLRIFSIFSGIVFFSFIGSSYTVYGQLRNNSNSWRSTKRSRPTQKSRAPRPKVRTRNSRPIASTNQQPSRSRRPQQRP